jgi:hypothetical protein
MAFVLAIGLSSCGGGGGGGVSISTDNFQGTWATQDASFKIAITKNGDQFDILRIIPITSGLTYAAYLSNQNLIVNTIINSAAAGATELTLISNNSIRGLVTSCSPPAGYSCAAPGTEIYLYRQ